MYSCAPWSEAEGDFWGDPEVGPTPGEVVAILVEIHGVNLCGPILAAAGLRNLMAITDSG